MRLEYTMSKLTGIKEEDIKKAGGAFKILKNRSKKEMALTPAKAEKLELLKEFYEEYSRVIMIEEDVIVDSSTIAKNYFQDLLKGEQIEKLYVATLDSRLKITNVKCISEGTVNSSIVHPREVVKFALDNEAVSILLAHNHPAGTTTPSHSDITLTKKVREALEAIDISLTDHIIATTNDAISMTEKGYM